MSNTAGGDQKRPKGLWSSNSSTFCLFLLEGVSVLAYLAGDIKEFAGFCSVLLLSQRSKGVQGQLRGTGHSCGSFWAGAGAQQPPGAGREEPKWARGSKQGSRGRAWKLENKHTKCAKWESLGCRTQERECLQQQSKRQALQCAERAVPVTTERGKS